MCERCSYGQCIVWIEQSYVDWSRFDDGSECEASSQYTGGKHRDAHTTSDFNMSAWQVLGFMLPVTDSCLPMFSLQYLQQVKIDKCTILFK